MKRWILLLLVLALLACLAGAQAEKHGAVVTVKLTVLENSGKAVGATVTLHWNSEALRFVSAFLIGRGGDEPGILRVFLRPLPDLPGKSGL